MRSLKITFLIASLVFAGVAARPVRAAGDPLEDLLRRTSDQVSSYLDRISEVSCSERVLQEKLGDKGKTVEKEESAFNYLIMLSSASGDVNLVESRLAEEDKPAKKTSTPFAREQRFFNVVSCFPSVLRGRIQVHGRRRRHPQWPETSQGFLPAYSGHSDTGGPGGRGTRVPIGPCRDGVDRH